MAFYTAVFAKRARRSGCRCTRVDWVGDNVEGRGRAGEETMVLPDAQLIVSASRGEWWRFWRGRLASVSGWWRR